ncbi:hypothetical protein PMAYCL1PPCAC_20519, partial [Pristionchus mayeri]
KLPVRGHFHERRFCLEYLLDRFENLHYVFISESYRAFEASHCQMTDDVAVDPHPLSWAMLDLSTVQRIQNLAINRCLISGEPESIDSGDERTVEANGDIAPLGQLRPHRPVGMEKRGGNEERNGMKKLFTCNLKIKIARSN